MVGGIVELFDGGAVVVLTMEVVETLVVGVTETLDDEEGGKTVVLLTDEVELTRILVLDEDGGGMPLL